MSGYTYARRGKARREGGAGRKITGVTHRRFMPNLQPARVLCDGHVKRIRVCTKCLKKGRVTRAHARIP